MTDRMGILLGGCYYLLGEFVLQVIVPLFDSAGLLCLPVALADIALVHPAAASVFPLDQETVWQAWLFALAIGFLLFGLLGLALARALSLIAR